MSPAQNLSLSISWLAVLSVLPGCGGPPPLPDHPSPHASSSQQESPCEGAKCRLERLVNEYERAEQGPQAATEWRTFATTSFRVIHRSTSELAQRLAKRAEAMRVTQLRYWGIASGAVPWHPKCDIYLYDSYQDLRLLTRGTTSHGSAQSRGAKLQAAALLSRKINLVRTDRRLWQDTLPHELSHIILQELLGNRRLPLWANEGMAVTWESRRKLESFLSMLQPHLRRGDYIPLATLFSATRYPDDERQKTLFYAQSAAIIYFLIGIDRSAATLLAFLRQISPPSYTRQAFASTSTIEAALLQHYGVSGIDELTRRWRQRFDKQ